ncbi:MAG TPA: nucleotide exchange factor GrpE [Actinomycetes bacterium]|nr:nucleotide exchange factor GrpE [Actinomycetes bacterium]
MPDHDSKRNPGAKRAAGAGDAPPGAGDVTAGAPEAEAGEATAAPPKAGDVAAGDAEAAPPGGAGDGQVPAGEAEGDGAPGRSPDEAEQVIEIEGELLEEGQSPSSEEVLADQVDRDVDAELQTARAEAERHLDDLRRLKADFENYRKRMLREQTQMAASASQALVARLLPVLDHFELAVGSAEQSRDFEKMLKGVEMVFGELRETLRHEGLEQIEAEGKPFDPQRHEAVVTVQDSDAEPGTVVGVVRAGYELQGRVIRPAMVRVAQQP